MIVFIVILSLVLSFVIFALAIGFKKGRLNKEKTKEGKKPLSYKQQQYLDYLCGSKESSYYGSNKIGQTTYNAFSDYVYEFFGYKQGTENNTNTIRKLIGNFDILPDGHKDITWPRSTTYLFDRYLKTNPNILEIDNERVLIIFHTSKNELYKRIKMYFKKKNIEIKNPPRIKPFSTKTNQYVVLNKYSEECTFLHFLLRNYYGKDRNMFGLQQNTMPNKENFNTYKRSSMKKYNLKTDYEFARYLLTYFFNKELSVSSLMNLKTPDINSIRDYINKWPGYNTLVWDKCKSINKELGVDGDFLS